MSSRLVSGCKETFINSNELTLERDLINARSVKKELCSNIILLDINKLILARYPIITNSIGKEYC